MNILNAGTPAYEQWRLELMKRRSESDHSVARIVSDIIDDVRFEGFAAVRRHSERLDKAPPREILRSERREAMERCDPKLLEALHRAAENIREFHQNLLTKSQEWEQNGMRLGVIVTPLRRVGLYVPGGTAAYPSSVLMNAVPAKVAGVDELIMVSPPSEHLRPEVLAAAEIAGVDRVYAVGGVQAVAALAYGAGDIPRVDKVVGPGNAYVAEAKRQLYGQIDIDMIAGPSELLVIADHTARPDYVAADLLSQAEHDVLAGCVLLTTDAALAESVKGELLSQGQRLARWSIAQKALENFGAIILCESLSQAVELANEMAPEHLEVQTVAPRALLPHLRNAGAVFLGNYASEPLGDYMAGPSHVLPTTGTARFFSPLSVDTFLKKKSLIDCSEQALRSVYKDIVRLAECESLTAHAHAIRIRFVDQ